MVTARKQGKAFAFGENREATKITRSKPRGSARICRVSRHERACNALECDKAAGRTETGCAGAFGPVRGDAPRSMSCQSCRVCGSADGLHSRTRSMSGRPVRRIVRFAKRRVVSPDLIACLRGLMSPRNLSRISAARQFPALSPTGRRNLTMHPPPYSGANPCLSAKPASIDKIWWFPQQLPQTAPCLGHIQRIYLRGWKDWKLTGGPAFHRADSPYPWINRT